MLGEVRLMNKNTVTPFLDTVYIHRVHEKNCTPVYLAITLANNVGF